jgi:hypothetical protein
MGGGVEPSMCCFLVSEPVKAEEIGAVGLVVEGDDAIGKDEGGIGVLGLVR